MGLFANKIGGIANKIGGITNKILVLFDRSIRIPRARTRIHKVFYPCNRCHLATLLDNQYVTCGNEVTRVTTNGDFALIFTQHSYYVYQHTACGLWSPGLRGTKPRASRGEGAASKGRRCHLLGSKVPPPSPIEGTYSKFRLSYFKFCISYFQIIPSYWWIAFENSTPS